MNSTIGVKKEMTQIYNEDGSVTPVTVVDVSDVSIAALLGTKEEVSHVVIGKGKQTKPNKPETVKYKDLGFVPEYTFSEKMVANEITEETKVGSVIDVSKILQIGDKVKVTGVSKGKGFQGVVKRWGFKGGPKTHGQSNKWRSPGSIGSGTTPGRVVKGKKMGGHMGARTASVKNIKVVALDIEKGILLLSGAVPGAKGSYITIQKQLY